VRGSLPSIGDGVQATLLHQMQQLQRWPGRLLLTDLPFLDGRETGTEQARENSLAHLRRLANRLDLCRLQGLDRRPAQTVELAQRERLHHAGFTQALAVS